jgi:ATP-dependent helicase/DNAse subunit B
MRTALWVLRRRELTWSGNHSATVTDFVSEGSAHHQAWDVFAFLPDSVRPDKLSIWHCMNMSKNHEKIIREKA